MPMAARKEMRPSGRRVSFLCCPIGAAPNLSNKLLRIRCVCQHAEAVANRARDAERVLNDLGGLFAVVTVDGSFQQVTHLRTRTVTTDIKPQR